MAQPAVSGNSLSPSPSDNETPRAPRTRSRDEESLQETPRKPVDVDLGELKKGDEESTAEMDSWQQMEIEKGMYPGASTWARDEERLFEILFLRQDLPLLPSHWDVDFRGVPISVATFQTSNESPPVVYAHSKKEFQATMALTRLIDLTSSVRTTFQSGLRQKTPKLIKKALDQYLSWAAQDGEYSHLRVVPNIVTEIIDVSMDMDDITEFMQRRMKAAAELQQEFLKVDRDVYFWTDVAPELKDPDATMEALVRERKQKIEEPERSVVDAELSFSDPHPDELATEAGETAKVDVGARKLGTFKSSITEMDELAHNDDEEVSSRLVDVDDADLKPSDMSIELGEPRTPPRVKTFATADQPQTPGTEAKSPTPSVEYTRDPPVVYGLFILNTSVFLLTVDSAKGDAGYVSFHLELDFLDRQQSVWNALTVAIAACLARDELRARVEDFDPLPTEEESDPDV